MPDPVDPVKELTALYNALNHDLPTRRQAELRRAGNAVRAIIERLVATEAPEDDVAALAGRIEALLDGLALWPARHPYGFAESSVSGHPAGFLDNSPVMGEANPLAPPLKISIDGATVVGTVRFGSAYEGPPGCVHGGWIAATFDEVLGTTQGLTGLMGMTGTLSVRYKKPTPLHHELRFEGELVRQEGRKIYTIGRCFADGRLTAEADALFISVDFSKIAALFADRPQAPE
ncbi:MAG: PaaI family thioesterase [Acidimicrobiales bacterium]